MQQREGACVCARACARACCVSAHAWYDHGTVALRVFNLLQKIGTICLHPARSVSNGCAQEAHSKPVSFKFDTTNSESAREDAPDHLNRLDTKPVIVGLLRTNASIASALKPRQMPRGIPQCTRKLHSLHRTLQCKESFARYPVEWQCNRRGTGHRERRGHRKRMRAAQRYVLTSLGDAYCTI